jgi:aspartate racemase
MRRIGLLGGMSWESSAEYYRLINEQVRDALGELHSADCVLRSVDFAEIEQLQSEQAWDLAAARLSDEARLLERAGSELLVLCTNTMHKVADEIAASIGIELVHIADATAAAIRESGLARVGLLATAYTMEQDFYVGRLCERHGLEVLVPGDASRALVHSVIYEELCLGIINEGSRQAFRAVIAELEARGAQAVILGCTEIGLLVGDRDAAVPVYDTTVIHARAAVRRALEP